MSRKITLNEIAHGRSGDKGNHANIAIIARWSHDVYQWLREYLTAQKVAKHFEPMDPSRVERFEAPNVRSLNFVLYDILHGGASRSLHIDTQGKTLALALLRMEIEVPDEIAAKIIDEDDPHGRGYG